jgi:hypothetical protein
VEPGRHVCSICGAVLHQGTIRVTRRRHPTVTEVERTRRFFETLGLGP